MSPQYLMDENGTRTGVLLTVNEYEELLEDLQDLAVVAKRRDEPSLSHEQAIACLKEDGVLPD